MLKIAVLILLMGFIYRNLKFSKSTYHKITGNSYLGTILDKGKYGEYLTYKKLGSIEKSGGKFLFNCYLPREDDKTTEIDVLLINSKGIFVFESKNYSGWIFGDEKAKNWTQTLPIGKRRSHKEHFLNPIMQNKLHIKWLKSLINENVPIHSIIVFSERCKLKNVSVESPDIHVINRYDLYRTVSRIKSGNQLSTREINDIYDKLYPYTQVSKKIKEQHIYDIQEIKNSKLPKKPNPVFEQSNPLQNRIEICPWCGKQLVLRTAAHGNKLGEQFYGCSGFPKCRYVKKLQK